MTRFSRGMTLVSVLVAVALLGILGAVLVTLFSQMSSTMIRSNVSSEGQNLVRFAQSILSQKYLCDYAMHPGVYNAGVNSTQDMVWNFAGGVASVPVGHLEINPGGAGGASRTLAMQVGDVVAPGLILNAMNLRLPKPALGEGQPTVTTMQAKWNPVTKRVDPAAVGGVSKTFNVTAAKFELIFQTPAAFSGGILRPQTVDVTVAADPVTNVIDFCYTGQVMQAVNFICNSAKVVAQPTGSHADCLPNPLYPTQCQPIYFIAGFDVNGNPICDCKTICEVNVSPPPPTQYH